MWVEAAGTEYDRVCLLRMNPFSSLYASMGIPIVVDPPPMKARIVVRIDMLFLC